MLKIFNTSIFIITLALQLVISKACFAELPQHAPVPGGVAVIKIIHSGVISAYYKNRQVLMKKSDGNLYAVVGISLSSKPGTKKIKLKTRNNTFTQTFSIKKKKYKSQHITIKNKRKVNPNAEDMKRIRKERKFITQALTHWQDNPIPTTRFIQPVKGIFSSPFGLKRFFNGQARRPHSGLDIAAPEGTPVIAPADGKIITTGNYFFNGNTVFIDHGQNLITMYNHLSEIIKPVGTIVKQGNIFAKVGKTGRVTGPHLHWSVSLNNTRVDPLLFFTPDRKTKK